MHTHKIVVFAIFALAGCSGSSSQSDSVLVYADRQAKQCVSEGLSPDESAGKLISAGIDVLSTDCGFQTGVAYPAVCGGGTPSILIHEIRRENLADAEEVGFTNIKALMNTETDPGYATVDCEQS